MPTTGVEALAISVFVGSPLRGQLLFLELSRLQGCRGGAVGGEGTLTYTHTSVGLADTPEGHPERSHSGTAVSRLQVDVSMSFQRYRIEFPW